MISNISPSAGAPAAAPDSSQTAASGKTPSQTPFPDFYALFNHTTAASETTTQASAPAPDTAAPANPSLESVFGSQPWLANPGGTGPNGTKWNYNPIYFATQATAEKVASMVGGTVVEKNDIITAGGGPFQQTAPNELIQFADGRTVNAGLVANFFDHGYPQSYIDNLLKNVTDGEQA